MKKILLLGGLAVCLVLLVLPFKIQAVSHGPTKSIEISPKTVTIASDTEQAMTLTAVDSNGVSWDVTQAAQFSTDDPFALIENNVYTAGKVGTWTISALIGNLSADTIITVIPGSLNSLVINPNSNPEIIPLDKTRQFEAIGFDKNNNKVENIDLTWSVEGGIGEISKTGLFKATKEGVSKVVAASNNISSFVTVKTRKTTEIIPVVTNANTSGQTTLIREIPEETKQGQVAGEEIAAAAENTNTNSSTTNEWEDTCLTHAWWIWLLLMIGYLVILIIYYFLVRKIKGSWWWIFPVLLTAASLWYFFAYACDQYNWWPWVTVIVGILATLFRPRSSQTSQTL